MYVTTESDTSTFIGSIYSVHKKCRTSERGREKKHFIDSLLSMFSLRTLEEMMTDNVTTVEHSKKVQGGSAP